MEFEHRGLQLGLGFQRLAILDLSPAGMQPMVHPDGNVLIFNGEIYNYLELKQNLEARGIQFRGKSDTEVLMHSLSSSEKIVDALKPLNGMWAFAWVDKRGNRLHLTRDRCGEKPLYYILGDTGVYFASEMRTLLALRGGRFPLNVQVLGQYLSQSLIDANNDTFLEGVHQVPAGAVVSFDLERWPLEPATDYYWHLEPDDDERLSEAAFIEKTIALFTDSVKIRLRSDVPVGVLLSGGIDSSSIAAVAGNILGPNANLNLLSSVSDPRYDESPFIDIMEKHLGTPVTRVQLRPDNVFSQLAEVTRHMDGPVGSLSNLAHYQLMQGAKELGVTVLLSGQGADEALCGYKKYLGFYLQSLFRSGQVTKGAQTLYEFWRNKSIIPQFTVSEAKRYLPKWLLPWKESILGPALRDAFRPIAVGLNAGESIQRRQLADITNFSVPALNHFEDRCSMAASREIRLPFLDPRLLKLFVSADVSMKLNHGWTKYGFRKAMQNFLPPEITWRKDKLGFVTPEAQWLRKELASEIQENYFGEDALIFKMKLINRDVLNAIYRKFQDESGHAAISHREIFSVVALEVWLRENEHVIAAPLAAAPLAIRDGNSQASAVI